jgi:hypothetical protein
MRVVGLEGGEQQARGRGVEHAAVLPSEKRAPSTVTVANRRTCFEMPFGVLTLQATWKVAPLLLPHHAGHELRTEPTRSVRGVERRRAGSPRPWEQHEGAAVVLRAMRSYFTTTVHRLIKPILRSWGIPGLRTCFLLNLALFRVYRLSQRPYSTANPR